MFLEHYKKVETQIAADLFKTRYQEIKLIARDYDENDDEVSP
jgi:hypothetical protein